MAYLYEDKELVYEKQMASLKKRIILVNITIFAMNLFASLILIFNNMQFVDFLTLILPVFLLNLVISYAILINRDSNEQLYLAMYISIIGTIVVMMNIFINSKTPATYMLLYLAIAIISVYKDKKAVALGYVIIFVSGTIIHFKYQSAIVGIAWQDYSINNLTPYLYESILLVILIVQIVRTIFNEREINSLYDQLDQQKELELKYQLTISQLMDRNHELIAYTDNYVNDQTKERVNKYVELFHKSFYIKEDLKLKIENYLNLQVYRNPQKVLGKTMRGYQLKKELEHFDEMSMFKLTKFFSLIMNITFKSQKMVQINRIKNFESIFMDPDMSIEVKIVGFIFLYEHLRNDKPFFNKLSHEQIVEYFNKPEVNELFDKEIIEFFKENEALFNEIYEQQKESQPEGETTEVMNK